MKTNAPSYRGYRFPPDIISHAVWLYHRFCLSFRNVEDLLAERGVIVSYETIRQWCRKFGIEPGKCVSVEKSDIRRRARHIKVKHLVEVRNQGNGATKIWLAKALNSWRRVPSS
jgi:transposase-like protein